MTVFNTTDLNQDIPFFNRTGSTPNHIVLTNEATNVSDSFNMDVLVEGVYFNVFNFTVTEGFFVENNFYFFRLFDVDNNILFQDKLFVTNQDVQNNVIYNINKDKYNSNVTTNEYTIYE